MGIFKVKLETVPPITNGFVHISYGLQVIAAYGQGSSLYKVRTFSCPFS